MRLFWYDRDASVTPPCKNSCHLNRTKNLGGDEGRTSWHDTDKNLRQSSSGLLPPESAGVEVVAREIEVGVSTLERWRADALSRPD